MVSPAQFAGAAVGTTVLAVLVHAGLGRYPPALERATGERTRQEVVEIAGLFLLAMAAVAYAVLVFRGIYENIVVFAVGGWQLDFVLVLSALSHVVVPLALERGVRGRSFSQLGSQLPTQWLPAAFLVTFGVGVGISAVGSDTATPAPLVALVAALYTPVLEEEILFRGVLQPKLERLVGIQWAWVGSGVLFGLSHVPIDFFGQFWLQGGGLPVATARLASQVGFGLLFGVVYAKTRSLLAPVVAHYCANELGAVVETLVG